MPDPGQGWVRPPIGGDSDMAMERITARAAMPSSHDESVPCTDLKAAVDAYEKGLVEAAYSRAKYNQRAAASALGLSYDQLRHCMKKHGISA